MDLAIAYRSDAIPWDLALDGADLALDAGLRTAAVISLLTDRRAGADDALPDGGTDRRGWWADAYAANAGDRIGSRLWLLDRAKQTRETARAAEDYAREALQWMTEDRVAAAVTATAEWRTRGVLALAVRIERPDGSGVDVRFDDLWEAMDGI